MSAQIFEYPQARARAPQPLPREQSGVVLILPVVRIERDDDFSIPAATSTQTLGQKQAVEKYPGAPKRCWCRACRRQSISIALESITVLQLNETFPESRQAGLEDGVAGKWRLLERAALSNFNVLAYTGGFTEAQLSNALVLP